MRSKISNVECFKTIVAWISRQKVFASSGIFESTIGCLLHHFLLENKKYVEK